MKKAKPDVIAALTDLCGGRLLVGEELHHKLTSGELVVDVRVTVRHKLTDELAVALRAQALAELVANPYRIEHCGCVVNEGKRGWIRREGDCTGRIVAAVVSKSQWRGKDEPRFTFVCRRHREKHGEDPKRVLGVVELAGFDLLKIHELLKLKRIADREKYCDECWRWKVDGACPVCARSQASAGGTP